MPRSKSQGVEGSVQNQSVKILRELTLTFSCRVERLCIYIYISIYLYLYLYIYIRRNPANLLPGGSPEALEA